METPAGRSVARAPAVEFVTERRGWTTQEQLAHAHTGHNVTTGDLTLTIAERSRRNGLVRFDGDLWKLPYDLHPHAIMRLATRWALLNAVTPKKVRSRMEQHFSRTTIIFDATAEQADNWREFLHEVLTDRESYADWSGG